MASASKTTITSALIALTVTAVLVYFGTGLFPRWPLLWFAPLPLLLFAQRNSWWATGFAAFLGWGLGALNLQHYFGTVLQMPASVQLAIFAAPAVLFAASVLLFRALLRRGAPWSALLAFPATYTAFEYLTSLSSPHGTAGSLSYSQLNFLPFLQLASVTGPWGMTFFLLLFSSGLAIFLDQRKTAPRLVTRMLGVCWGLIAVVLIFGAVRLASSASEPKVKVGLVASDLPENQDVAHEGAGTERLFREYAARAEELASQGAQAVVLPEKLGVLLDSDQGGGDAILQSVADKANGVLVVGAIEVAPPVRYNQARIYLPAARLQKYNKHHMLPPFESRFKPGTTLELLNQPSGTWGVAICKDMDFTPLSREYGKRGAGLMLVPAWDFVVDRWSHGHIAVMRGVEDGFSIARAARQGYLTISDNRGRIVAETQSNAAPFATLLAEVPAAHDATIYEWFGDWFGWMSAAIVLMTCVQLYRVRSSTARSGTLRETASPAYAAK